MMRSFSFTTKKHHFLPAALLTVSSSRRFVGVRPMSACAPPSFQHNQRGVGATSSRSSSAPIQLNITGLDDLLTAQEQPGNFGVQYEEDFMPASRRYTTNPPPTTLQSLDDFHHHRRPTSNFVDHDMFSGMDFGTATLGTDQHCSSSAHAAPLNEIQQLEHQIKALKIRRKTLLKAIKAEKEEEALRVRMAKDIVKMAEKPWSALRVPIVTNAFKLFVDVQMADHRDLVEQIKDVRLAKKMKDQRKTGGKKKRAAAESKLPRKPTVKQLRAKWSNMLWQDKRIYVVATKRNQALKKQMAAKVLHGCPDFDRFSRTVEAQVSTVDTVRAAFIAAEETSTTTSARSTGRKDTAMGSNNSNNSLLTDINALWSKVVAMDRQGVSPSNDEMIQAKLHLMNLVEGTNMHQMQNH